MRPPALAERDASHQASVDESRSAADRSATP